MKDCNKHGRMNSRWRCRTVQYSLWVNKKGIPYFCRGLCCQSTGSATKSFQFCKLSWKFRKWFKRPIQINISTSSVQLSRRMKKHKTTFIASNNYDLDFNCRAFNMTVTEHHTALQHQRIYFVVLMEKKFSNLTTATPITNMQVFF